jgi:hypothetical protein
MRINRSAETFSLSGLREWIEAVRDAQYDTDWLAAIDYASQDRDAVVVISGPLFEEIVEQATKAGVAPQGHLRGMLEDYRKQLAKVSGKNVPAMTTHYRPEGIWITQRTPPPPPPPSKEDVDKAWKQAHPARHAAKEARRNEA